MRDMIAVCQLLSQLLESLHAPGPSWGHQEKDSEMHLHNFNIEKVECASANRLWLHEFTSWRLWSRFLLQHPTIESLVNGFLFEMSSEFA